MPTPTRTTCAICGKSADAPFRIYDDRGRVSLGCIDAFHDGALIAGTESARWHNRPEAKAMRRKSKERLRSILRR